MPIADVATLRNVVLLSHNGAGKTSLGEALLFQTKAITRMGRVDDGNTVSDYEAEEAKRTSSVQTSLLPCNWEGCKINLLDTPGYDDFAGEVVSALRVADAAVILVAAPSSVSWGPRRVGLGARTGACHASFTLTRWTGRTLILVAPCSRYRNCSAESAFPSRYPSGASRASRAWSTFSTCLMTFRQRSPARCRQPGNSCWRL